MTLIPDLQRDLVEAAARGNELRHRFSGPLRIAAATVAAAALGVGAATWLDDDGPDRGAARDGATTTRPPSRTVTGHLTPPPAPAIRPPLPGSVSEPLAFSFDGVRYRGVGFRNRGGSICTTLTTNDAANPGGGCLAERGLRRALADNPFRTFAGAGGEHTSVTGFARADVTRLTLVGTRLSNRVALSKPWSPKPWRGERIRFYHVLVDAQVGPPPGRMLPEGSRLEARISSGELVESSP